MAAHANDQEFGGHEETPRPGGPIKKAYRSPCLVDYGDIRRLTAGAAGTKGDSSPPGGKSRT
jgi:hypothetical protein